jgi:hypothetical protein
MSLIGAVVVDGRSAGRRHRGRHDGGVVGPGVLADAQAADLSERDGGAGGVRAHDEEASVAVTISRCALVRFCLCSSELQLARHQ